MLTFISLSVGFSRINPSCALVEKFVFCLALLADSHLLVSFRQTVILLLVNSPVLIGKSNPYGILPGMTETVTDSVCGLIEDAGDIGAVWVTDDIALKDAVTVVVGFGGGDDNGVCVGLASMALTAFFSRTEKLEIFIVPNPSLILKKNSAF